MDKIAQQLDPMASGFMFKVSIEPNTYSYFKWCLCVNILLHLVILFACEDTSESHNWKTRVRTQAHGAIITTDSSSAESKITIFNQTQEHGGFVYRFSVKAANKLTDSWHAWVQTNTDITQSTMAPRVAYVIHCGGSQKCVLQSLSSASTSWFTFPLELWVLPSVFSSVWWTSRQCAVCFPWQ